MVGEFLAYRTVRYATTVYTAVKRQKRGPLRFYGPDRHRDRMFAPFSTELADV